MGVGGEEAGGGVVWGGDSLLRGTKGRRAGGACKREDSLLITRPHESAHTATCIHPVRSGGGGRGGGREGRVGEGAGDGVCGAGIV